MKILQLFINDNEILGSDGIMHVDGRLNESNVKLQVIERNKRYSKNFPHLVATHYATFRNGSIKNGYTNKFKL